MTENGTAPPVIDVTAAPVTALAPAAPSMIRPVGSMSEIVEAWNEFGRVKQALLHESDYQGIKGRTFVKKSGWRKIAAAFGISLELRSEHRETLAEGPWGWEVVVRAIAPNGRFSDGTASCWSNERVFSHVQHDVRAQAYTRAANRAISDLVGGGEVSAEEMQDEDRPAPKALPAKPAAKPAPVVEAPIGIESDLYTAVQDEIDRTATDVNTKRKELASFYKVGQLHELTATQAQHALKVLKTRPTVSEVI